MSKRIDHAAGAEREVVGKKNVGDGWGVNAKAAFEGAFGYKQEFAITTPATLAARQWSGWGTALKPAAECWWLLRKPLAGTVAENVLAHGTGALNIDGCRIPAAEGVSTRPRVDAKHAKSNSLGDSWHGGVDESERFGRWPANLCHDGSPEVLAGFPVGKVGARPAGQVRHVRDGDIPFATGITVNDYPASEGSASRFFYCAKSSRSERDFGLDNTCNVHATVKPISLMRWLVRLVTPPGGIVLDPFAGSGSTLCAAVLEGFNPLGFDLSAEYAEIANARIDYWRKHPEGPAYDPEPAEECAGQGQLFGGPHEA